MLLSQKLLAENKELYEKAKALYEKDRSATHDMSDFWSGFSFAIDTYSPLCWEKYFKNGSIAQ